jgi:hypothetical protein
MGKFTEGDLLPEDDPIFSGSWIIHSRQSSSRLTPDMRRAMERALPENLENYQFPEEEDEELNQEE